MKSYLLSFAAGLLVGCIYSLIRVRSPAPPLIALIGLLGILLGEQSPSLIKHFFTKEDAKTSQASGQLSKTNTDLEGKS